MNLSDYIPTIPLPPISELMWLRGGIYPSGTQTPIPGRDVVSWLSPSNPHPEERPLPPFQMALRDLGDAQLRQLMEDLQQKAGHRELIASLIGPPLDCWRTPASDVDANLEDEEGTFPGGGDGDLVSCHCSLWAPHTEEDVGHLLSTLAAKLRLGTLRINTFSRDATLGKSEVSFVERYHVVQCVKNHYPESVVWERA